MNILKAQNKIHIFCKSILGGSALVYGYYINEMILKNVDILFQWVLPSLFELIFVIISVFFVKWYSENYLDGFIEKTKQDLVEDDGTIFKGILFLIPIMFVAVAVALPLFWFFSMVISLIPIELIARIVDSNHVYLEYWKKSIYIVAIVPAYGVGSIIEYFAITNLAIRNYKKNNGGD